MRPDFDFEQSNDEWDWLQKEPPGWFALMIVVAIAVVGLLAFCAIRWIVS